MSGMHLDNFDKQHSETQKGSIVTIRNIQESQLDAFEGVWCNYVVANKYDQFGESNPSEKKIALIL